MNSTARHSHTAKQIETYLKNPSQVLAIVGAPGSGKLPIAKDVASKLTNSNIDTIEQNPSVLIVERPEDKQEISIDAIRSLISKLKTKTDSTRVVLISNADLLSLEAQNGLLKTLEQPGENTYFILTISSDGFVLPTVMSRAEKLIVHPISLSEALDFYVSRFSKEQITSAWNLSEGNAQLIENTLADPNSRSTGIEAAKLFLKSDKYERLLITDKLAKDRAQALEFVNSLYLVLKALHHANIKKSNDDIAKRLLAARKLVDRSMQMIKANASTKLVLLNLVTSLRV
jgi:DNA polymerase III delta prime subunit